MTDLSQGGNGPVEGASATVAVNWTAPSAAFDVDASAYLLTEAGKVRGDADMVFYNQPTGADGAVAFRASGDGAKAAFDVELARVPADIARIVFCVTINEATAKGQTCGQLSPASIAVGPKGGAASLRFAPALAGASEAAMIFGELYRRQGQWKFRAVGQGFNGGLAPLARSFGIDVADEPAAAPPPPPPPPPPKPISLSKVTLEKKGQSVSLEKSGASGFGEIVINLNWSRPPVAAAPKKGLFGGRPAQPAHGAGGLDLDLGCLFELADGRKGAVQALGKIFGSFSQPPYIELSGDDRTGDASQGETLRINGARWSEIRRVAVFAMIYEGAPNWQATDGVVTVNAPGQPPVEIRMSEGQDDRRLCGVVLLENAGGQLKVTRIVDYHVSQRELDQAHGWGLRWGVGSKD